MPRRNQRGRGSRPSRRYDVDEWTPPVERFAARAEALPPDPPAPPAEPTTLDRARGPRRVAPAPEASRRERRRLPRPRARAARRRPLARADRPRRPVGPVV